MSLERLLVCFSPWRRHRKRGSSTSSSSRRAVAVAARWDISARSLRRARPATRRVSSARNYTSNPHHNTFARGVSETDCLVYFSVGSPRSHRRRRSGRTAPHPRCRRRSRARRRPRRGPACPLVCVDPGAAPGGAAPRWARAVTVGPSVEGRLARLVAPARRYPYSSGTTQATPLAVQASRPLRRWRPPQRPSAQGRRRRQRTAARSRTSGG